MTLVWNICKDIKGREREKEIKERQRREGGMEGGWEEGERGAGKDEEGTLATTILPDAQTNKNC